MSTLELHNRSFGSSSGTEKLHTDINWSIVTVYPTATQSCSAVLDLDWKLVTCVDIEAALQRTVHAPLCATPCVSFYDASICDRFETAPSKQHIFPWRAREPEDSEDIEANLTTKKLNTVHSCKQLP